MIAASSLHLTAIAVARPFKCSVSILLPRLLTFLLDVFLKLLHDGLQGFGDVVEEEEEVGEVSRILLPHHVSRVGVDVRVFVVHHQPRLTLTHKLEKQGKLDSVLCHRSLPYQGPL